MQSILSNMWTLMRDFFSKVPSNYHAENSIVITINPEKHSEVRLKIKKGGE